MNAVATTLLKRIRDRKAKVGILGMGYVGMPLARAFWEGGFHVTGFDTDADKVRRLNLGRSYIQHIPSRSIAEMRKSRRFRASHRFADMKRLHALIICVPTPLTESMEPDLSYIEATGAAIRDHLRPGQLVVLESTTYPGTTREVLQPLLETAGLRSGKDFFVAYSPEREDPGNPNFETRTIPKVVGGEGPAALRLACDLYAAVIDRVVPVSSCAAAEAAKLLENIYRCVNIALVNELKMLFDRMDINIWEVIGAASTKPFGFHPFYPGPGLGGHCIPIDPFYLSWKARQFDVRTRFIELAGEVNTSIPYYVVHRAAGALNDVRKTVNGSSILILGVSYKANVGDLRESPSLKLMSLLQQRGARIEYHDPLIPRLWPTRAYNFGLSSRPLTPARLRRTDLVLIATNHDAVDYQMVVDHAPLVLDTRNATAGLRPGRAHIVRA